MVSFEVNKTKEKCVIRPNTSQVVEKVNLGNSPTCAFTYYLPWCWYFTGDVRFLFLFFLNIKVDSFGFRRRRGSWGLGDREVGRKIRILVDQPLFQMVQPCKNSLREEDLVLVRIL